VTTEGSRYAVSALSDYLSDHLPVGWQKPQLVDALSGTLDRATVYRYLAGNHPRNPTESVLQAFASVLPGVSVVQLREAANLSSGAEEPWIPPVEANRLSYAQRRALDAFIKVMVGPAEDNQHAEIDEARHETIRTDSAETGLTSEERAEVQTYIDRLYASGRRDLADRVAASLVIDRAAENPSSCPNN
jgi:hypothetical protein